MSFLVAAPGTKRLPRYRDCRIDGNVPRGERGTNLRVTPDEGTGEFDALYRRAAAGPFWSRL